jgi:hypothetical protein
MPFADTRPTGRGFNVRPGIAHDGSTQISSPSEKLRK